MELILNTRQSNRIFAVTDEEKKICFGIDAPREGDCLSNFIEGVAAELNSDDVIINKVNYDESYAEGTVEFTSIEDGERFQRKYTVTAIYLY